MSGFSVSVVVCTYNRKVLFRRALESLRRQDAEFPYEVVVIDDGSTDGTGRMVREFTDQPDVTIPIRYVRENSGGIARARNRGIQEASGEWIAFTDDDQVADPSWLRELVSLATEQRATCVGGPRRLSLLEGGVGGLSPICRRILGEIEEGAKTARYRARTYPCTGNVLMKRSVYESVGPFDESLKCGGSDIEFFKRVEMAGFEPWYAPRAVVQHLIPPYRVRADYLLWRSLAQGTNFATRDRREWGIARTLLVCGARIGQAVLVNAPLLAWAHLVGDDAEKLGRRCLLRRANGYARQCLYYVAPKAFSQSTFFRWLEFRREREIFVDASQVDEEVGVQT